MENKKAFGESLSIYLNVYCFYNSTSAKHISFGRDNATWQLKARSKQAPKTLNSTKISVTYVLPAGAIHAADICSVL